MIRIVALLTCHNRREKTLACLESLFATEVPRDTSVDAFLVDDGCTDGTAEAVARRFPSVNILRGNGSLYWNGGMRLAFGEAMKRPFDYYLWLNDDTQLYSDALANLITESKRLSAGRIPTAIIVGSTQENSTGSVSYGGVTRGSRWRPLKFTTVTPQAEAVTCDAMNGNCVLVPAAVVRTIGNLDPAFTHSMGDFDYGLRAKKSGFSIWVMPGFAGACGHNDPAGSWRDTALSLGERLRKLSQAKGLPIAEWAVFAMRHGGLLGPAYCVWPFIKVVITSVTSAGSSTRPEKRLSPRS